MGFIENWKEDQNRQTENVQVFWESWKGWAVIGAVVVASITAFVVVVVGG
ncbi:hypothetical protein [Lysinibacter cavernae]